MKGVRKVGILGGMGPAAGAEFVRMFVEECRRELLSAKAPVVDQAFPEHYLFQVPVPDRTSALHHDAPDRLGPLEAMSGALGQMSYLGVNTVAIACNTAHAWHRELQERFPRLNILDVAAEVALMLHAGGVRAVGLMATEGTYASGIYARALGDRGVECVLPSAPEQRRLMQGIYEGVKAGDLPLATECFAQVAQGMASRTGVRHIAMACTEIPLALEQAALKNPIDLIDPARMLAAKLARCAYGWA